MAVPTARPRGIRVRTTFATEPEFVAGFHDLCDESTIFAPTEKMKPVGADCAFSLELADGSPMVRGLGVIKNVWATDDSPFGRPGIHIEIDQLTNTSEPIFNALLAAREAAKHKPRSRPAPQTHQLWGKSCGPPTEEIEVPEVEPEVLELPTRITREIRGVADLTDHVEEERETKDRAPRYRAPNKSRPPTLPGAVAPAPIPRPRLASAPIPIVSTAPANESVFDVDGALAASRPRPWWMTGRVGAVFAGGLVLGLVTSLLLRSSPPVTRVTVAAPVTQVAAAKPEPPNCPPPAEPAQSTAIEAPPPVIESKARVAKTTPSTSSTKPTPPTEVTKPGAVATTKPAAVIKAPAFAPAKATTKPALTTKVADTKKPAKQVCSSLDCI